MSPLSTQLVNESSPECKKLIADSLIKLFKRITETDRNLLFNDMIIQRIQSEERLQRLLASHLCSLLLTIENKDFFKRLPNLLPFIKQQLDPTRYDSSQDIENSSTKSTDSLVYQHLNLFIKLIKTDPQFIKKKQFVDEINAILEYILTDYLLHPTPLDSRNFSANFLVNYFLNILPIV